MSYSNPGDLRLTDVSKVARKLETFDDFESGSGIALDTKVQNAAKEFGT
jgi:hypothetical protein